MTDTTSLTDDRPRQAQLDVGEASKRTSGREPAIEGTTRFADDRDDPAPGTEQAPLVAEEPERSGFARFREDFLGFEEYGPHTGMPWPVRDYVALPGTDRDARELTGTGLAPGDFEILAGKCSPATARRYGYHPDDRHREDHYPSDEEALTAADLETVTETMHETNDPERSTDLRTDGGETDTISLELPRHVVEKALAATHDHWQQVHQDGATTPEDGAEWREAVDAFGDALRDAPAADGGRPEPTERVVVYTASGYDGAVHRVTATNTTWNVDVARQMAAADCRDRTGSVPCDVGDIEILDIRESDDDRELVTDGGHPTEAFADAAEALDHAVGLAWRRTDAPQSKFAEMLRNLADLYDEAPEEAARPSSTSLPEYVPATDGGQIDAEALRECYDNAAMWSPGTRFEYRGYRFEKVEAGGPYHDEYAVYNPAGRKVESYTVGAFDSFEAFRDRVDELIDYDPDSLGDWLHRDREQ